MTVQIAVTVIAVGVAASAYGVLRHAWVRLAWLLAPAFRVGDDVVLGSYAGVVESIGWLTVTLRTRSGDLVTLPNGSAAQEPVVQSVSASGSQGIDLILAIPPDAEPGAARQAALQAVRLTPYLALDRPYSVALEQGAAGQVLVRVQAGVFDASQQAPCKTSIIEAFHACLRWQATRDRSA